MCRSEEYQKRWDANTTAIGQYRLLAHIGRVLWDRLRGLQEDGTIGDCEYSAISQAINVIYFDILDVIDKGEVTL